MHSYLLESLDRELGLLVAPMQVGEGGLHRARVLLRLITLADDVSERLLRRRRHVVLLSCNQRMYDDVTSRYVILRHVPSSKHIHACCL